LTVGGRLWAARRAKPGRPRLVDLDRGLDRCLAANKNSRDQYRGAGTGRLRRGPGQLVRGPGYLHPAESCQHEWQHTAPKAARAGARMSVTLRHSREGWWADR
jgi:hypothetical protein